MTTTIILNIIAVFSALAIIVLALMQTSKSDMGSAFGGGGSQSMFGSRGSANFLTRLTSIMCLVFFVSSLSLAYLYSKRNETNSVVEQSVIVDAEPSIEQTIDAVDQDLPSTPNAEPIETTVESAIEDAVDAVSGELPVVPE